MVRLLFCGDSPRTYAASCVCNHMPPPAEIEEEEEGTFIYPINYSHTHSSSARPVPALFGIALLRCIRRGEVSRPFNCLEGV